MKCILRGKGSFRKLVLSHFMFAHFDRLLSCFVIYVETLHMCVSVFLKLLIGLKNYTEKLNHKTSTYALKKISGSRDPV